MNLPYVFVSTIICQLILAFSWRVFLYLRSITKYWKVRNVEYVNPQQLFGNFLNVLLSQESFVIKVKYLYDAINGPFGGIYLFTRPVLLVRNPELIMHIFNIDDNKFCGCELLTNNLLVFKGNLWDGLPTKVPAPFSQKMVKQQFDVIKNRCAALRKQIEREIKLNNVLDARQLINQLTTDTTASILYSIEVDSFRKQQDPLCEIGRLLANSTRIGELRSLLVMTMPSVVDYFNICTMDPVVKKMFRKVTEQSLQLRDSQKLVHFDYMQILTQVRNCGKLSDDGKWDSSSESYKHQTIDEVVTEAFLFFAFVFLTSSSTTLFALLELAKNKEIQRKLQTEIDQALKSRKHVKNDGTQSMNYLEQVYKETLRKYPAIPIIAQTVEKRFKLTDTDIVLDENQLVFVPIYAIHHDSKYYAQPDEFNPDRFTKDEIQKRTPGTFFPYGNSRLKVVSVTYATLQVKMSIVAICSKFDLDLAPDHDTAKVGDNFNLRFTSRK